MFISEKSLKALDFSQLLELVAQYAQSDLGKELIRNISPGTPPNDSQLVENVFQALKHELSLNLHGIVTMAPIAEVLPKGGFLSIDHLFVLRQNLVALETTRKALQQHPKANLLTAFFTQDYSWILEDILRTVNPQGEILDHASSELARIRSARKTIRSQIEKSLSKFINEDPKELQEDFYDLRNRRFVIPVKSQFQNQVPGKVVGYSRSKATTFIEPHFVAEHSDKVRQLELDEDREIVRILMLFSDRIRPVLDQLLSDHQKIIHLDTVQARSRYMTQIKGCALGKVTDRFYLPTLTHPMLLLDPKRKAVRNSFVEDMPGGIVVSGPNAGGKSVFLKSLGLAVVCNACSIPVATQDVYEIPHFDQVFFIMGDSQELAAGLSSFSAQISAIKDILENIQSGKKTFIVIDEILSFTDPIEASALAKAIIEDLRKDSTFVAVSTHFEDLILTTEKLLRGYSLNFDTESGTPSFKLVPGSKSRSYAMETAARLGLSPEILARAHSYIDKERDRLIKWEESLRANAAFQEEKLEGLREREKAIQTMYQDWETEKQKDELRFREKLSSLDSEIKRLTNELQKSQSPEIIKEVTKRRIKIEDQLPKAPEENLGDAVKKLSEKFAGKFGTSPSKQKTPFHSTTTEETPAPPPEAQMGSRLDLRGVRLDEALSIVERALNNNMMRKQRWLTIVHGHGTGVLKSEIRSNLKDHPLVKSFNPGPSNSGGDGVTIVEIEL